MGKERDIFYHDCELEDRDNILLTKYPGNTRKEKFCRAWKYYFTLSYSIPRTRRMYKSTYSMDKERTRHILNYPNIIHPFSPFRYCWETFMIFVYTYAFIMIPLSAMYSFASPERTEVVIYVQIDLPHYLFCCFDIFINFNSGYVTSSGKVVELRRWKIALHYMITYFIFDLASSLPLEYIFPVLQFECQYCDWLALVRYVKFVRVYTVELYFFRWWEKINGTVMIAEIIWYLVRFCLFVHLLTSVHFLIGWSQISREVNAWVQTNDVTDRYYQRSFHRALGNMFNSGFGLFYPETKADQILTVVGLVFGSVFDLLFVGKILQFVYIINASTTKYDEIIHNLKDYMQSKQIPNDLQKRLIEYYEFRYQKCFFKEAEILNVLSSQLRQEILLHTCRRLVENVSFFNNLPAGLLLRIVLCMRAEMFLANDVVVKAGARGECMYFITSGTVAIYTTTGREVCHLEDGAHFGEIALVLGGQRRVASVVAIECCELYRLDQRDFVRAINPFPDLVTRIERVAEERYERTMQMDAGDKRRRAIRRLSEAHHELRRSELLGYSARSTRGRMWRRGVQKGSSTIS